jgi:hypothetical protein
LVRALGLGLRELVGVQERRSFAGASTLTAGFHHLWSTVLFQMTSRKSRAREVERRVPRLRC